MGKCRTTLTETIVHIITQTVMKYCTTITNFSSSVTKFSHIIW